LSGQYLSCARGNEVMATFSRKEERIAINKVTLFSASGYHTNGGSYTGQIITPTVLRHWYIFSPHSLWLPSRKRLPRSLQSLSLGFLYPFPSLRKKSQRRTVLHSPPTPHRCSAVTSATTAYASTPMFSTNVTGS